MPKFTNAQLHAALDAAKQQLPEGARITIVVSTEEEKGKYYHNRISNAKFQFSKQQLEVSLNVMKLKEDYGRRFQN